MSIVERALGKLRGLPTSDSAAPDESLATDTSTLPADAILIEPISDLASIVPSTTVRMVADERDPIGAYWRGNADPALANQFRSLRRELLTVLRTVTPEGRAPILLITSALPGDGKTFISMAVARSFANTPDHRVTLVDMDAIRRTCSGLFCAEDRQGIAECLAGTADLRSVVCATDVPRLHLIPAGNSDSGAREALMSTRMNDLLARLRASGSGNLFVLDAPPVLPVVEVASLASRADLVLVVTRSAVTSQKAVSETLAKLGSHVNIAVVLNGAARAMAGDYSDYYGTAPKRR